MDATQTQKHLATKKYNDALKTHSKLTDTVTLELEFLDTAQHRGDVMTVDEVAHVFWPGQLTEDNACGDAVGKVDFVPGVVPFNKKEVHAY